MAMEWKVARDETVSWIVKIEVEGEREKGTDVCRELDLLSVCNSDQTWVLLLAVGVCIIHRRVFAVMSH